MIEARYSIDELNARLMSRARDLCVRLFGRIETRGAQIWMLNPNRKDPNFTSFSFNTHSGVWKDFSFTDCGGKGCMSLICAFATNGDWKRAFAWAKDFLGVTGRAPDPAEAKRFELAEAARNEKAKADAIKSRRVARGLWLAGTPLTGADPASLYLNSRGIDVLSLAGGIPSALHFHPQVHAKDDDKEKRGPWPAMLAAIARPGEGIVAVHRTYLRQAPDGAWTKRVWPECKTGKQVKGAFAGGYIALTRGESGKALRDAPAGEWIQVGEGIEDALSGALARPDVRAIAGVSLANIGGLQLPPQIAGAFILMQNDSDPVTLKQFDQAMDRLAERGIEPAIVKFDPRFKDINDAICGVEKRQAA